MRRSAAALLLLGGAAALHAEADLSKLLAHHNRGIALAEQHRFADAAAELEQVTKLAPTWATGWVNLGLAWMNTAKEYARAEAAFGKALALEPENPWARFSMGVMLESLGRKEESFAHLERAAAAAPDDADVQFKLGQGHQAKGELDAARACFERAIALVPEHASALYALGLIEVRQGKSEQGKARLATFEKLRLSHEGRTWGLKYTEMGHYADVIRLAAPPGPPLPARSAGAAATLEDATPRNAAGSVAKPFDAPAPTVAAADLDGDGDVDLLAGGSILEAAGGKLAAREAPALAKAAAGGAWLLDADNDGDLDALLANPLRLARRDAQGFGAPAAIDGAVSEVASLTVAEMDSDGDADVVVAGKPTFVLGNDRDGTFTPGAELASEARAALAFDADGDVDADLLLLGTEPRLLRNDRLLRFTPAGAPPLPGRPASAAAGDLDGDGDLDVVTPTGLLRNDGGMLFSEMPGRRPSGSAVALADLDRDGLLDLVVGSAEPRPLLELFSPALSASVASSLPLDAAPLGLATGDLDGDGDLDVAAALGAGGLRIVAGKGAESRRGIALELRGPQRAGEARANRLGIGARVEVKVGGRVQVAERTAGAGASQSLGPLVFGLGEAGKADYVRIVWPDGVIQSEVEVSAGAASIDEVQRKAGSCPTLFAWDGTRFAFVADLLGGGGVGFYAGPDLYAPPDPTELVALPGLVPRSGRLELRLLEPLEEITYLDEVALLAVEHPEGVEIFPDERFAVAEPLPSGRILAVAERIVPVEVRNERGEDVTELVARVDRRPAGPAARDPHFLGLAPPLSWSARFERPLPPDAALFLHSFIEYGYSSTVYAAAQAGLAYEPMSLDVKDEATGLFRQVATIGYPAGTPRMMTFPLQGAIPPGTRELRIRTNMTISIDQLFVATDLAAAPDGISVTRIRPVAATLGVHGYPREFSPDGAEPLVYDYGSVDGTRHFKRPAGEYTRLGDVGALLEAVDDRFVIFGPGEEVALAFDAGAVPPPAPGRVVSYVLAADGFCKDMDLYTAHPDTVEPLPYHAMPSYPYPPDAGYPDDEIHARYRREWNTRSHALEGRR